MLYTDKQNITKMIFSIFLNLFLIGAGFANCPYPKNIKLGYGGHLIYATSSDGTYWSAGSTKYPLPADATFIFNSVLGMNTGDIRNPEIPYKFNYIEHPPTCSYSVISPNNHPVNNGITLQAHQVNFILDNSNNKWTFSGGGMYGYNLSCRDSEVDNCVFQAS